jgi:hypothetical protein
MSFVRGSCWFCSEELATPPPADRSEIAARGCLRPLPPYDMGMEGSEAARNR